MRPFLRTLGLLIFVTAGCASSQSAPSASSAVDVTGTWVGTIALAQYLEPYTLRLEQIGSKVVGEVIAPRPADIAGPLEGTITGNELNFRTAHSGAELTVTGNEMRGYATGLGSRLLLRRQQ